MPLTFHSQTISLTYATSKRLPEFLRIEKKLALLDLMMKFSLVNIWTMSKIPELAQYLHEKFRFWLTN